MATGGEEKVGYSLANVGTLTLEKDTDKHPWYISIVVCQDKIVVLDEKTDKVKIHGLHDGKFLALYDILELWPRDMCLMDAMTICVIHKDGLIKMMSIDSTDMSRDIKTTRTLRLQGVLLDRYDGVVRFKDNLVVTGVKQGMMYWCIVSLQDGHVDKIHQICKGDGSCRVTTTKDTIIYISCCAGWKSPDTGVYGFDILNPSQCKYKYKHQRLQYPASIVINEDGNIFVCNARYPYYCIHQLTASCQLVAIFRHGIPSLLQALCWYNGFLYGTRYGRHDITVFSHVYQGSHKASEVPVSNERKHPVTEETAIQIGQGNGIPWNLYAIFWDNGCLYGTRWGSRDITVFSHVYQGNQKYSEVETSMEIEQGNVDKGQSDVKTEMPPSGPSPEDSKDKEQVQHKASEVLMGQEREQPIIEETSTQIVQEIPIQQRVEETLNQAGIEMSSEDQDIFLRFQHEIGTTLFFSADQQSLIDAQKSLDTTEAFLQKNRPDIIGKWLEYREQGKLTPELIDVIYAEERDQNLHQNKDYFLDKMEKLNIIARARTFNENGVKEENYFFTPCMLRKESPREVITPEKDARMVSTSVLCWVITGKFMLPGIFQKLIAACLAHWPVAKKKQTSENLIFQDCTVFDLDLIHRLFLHCENHAVYARISRMGIDNVNAKICTRARKFITMNLSEIISRQDPNSKYMLCVQNAESQDIPEDIRSHLSPPCEMWFMDEVHDPDAPITREHMNHARLCVALVTVCGKAMRTILQTNVSLPHTSIYQAILANKAKLISKTRNGSGKWQNALLNKDQCKMLFQDPKHRYMAPIDQFDISLLYSLIRNVSGINPPSMGWGVAPQDRPRDKSLGANVERIHLYRNEICGHSVDGQISQQDFGDYWKKIDSVLHDIDDVIGGKAFSQELEMQRRQVISIYEAC